MSAKVNGPRGKAPNTGYLQNHVITIFKNVKRKKKKRITGLVSVARCLKRHFVVYGASSFSSKRSTFQLNISAWVFIKLQALVYDILPSTTAVFSYAIGSRKLSANEQFLFVCCWWWWWCSNSSKFVTNNSDCIRRLFYN